MFCRDLPLKLSFLYKLNLKMFPNFVLSLTIKLNLGKFMRNLFNARNLIKLLLTAIIMPAASSSNAQQIKPTGSGYAPANGTRVYYEVYGDGKPIVLLHGSFYTIEMNWGELIPELAKTRKVIAIELQGHGHTPFSDRKLSRSTLARDVEKVMDYLKILLMFPCCY